MSTAVSDPEHAAAAPVLSADDELHALADHAALAPGERVAVSYDSGNEETPPLLAICRTPSPVTVAHAGENDFEGAMCFPESARPTLCPSSSTSKRPYDPGIRSFTISDVSAFRQINRRAAF